jgi:hypothetical protein
VTQRQQRQLMACIRQGHRELEQVVLGAAAPQGTDDCCDSRGFALKNAQPRLKGPR